MGQFPHCIAYISAGDLSSIQVRRSIESLLDALFGDVEIRLSSRAFTAYSIQDAADAISSGLALATLAHVTPETITPQRALRVGADGISDGITINTSKPGVGKQWVLFLRRSPLPMLEMKTYHGSGLTLKRQREEALATANAVVWTDGPFGIGGKSVLGCKVNVYLWLKWLRLYANKKTEVTPSTVAAGLCLSRYCNDIIKSLPGDGRLAFRLKDSVAAHVRFEQMIDQVFVDKLPGTNVGQLLSEMGCSVEKWLLSEPHKPTNAR